MTVDWNEEYLDDDSQKDKYLSFTLDQESYGIEIKYVTEIIGIQKITTVPEMPDFIRGIVNLRGRIIPVMDVRIRFKKQFREYEERTCIIVIHINDRSIGLIVDSVTEVLTIPSGEIVIPSDLYKQKNSFVMGIGKVEEEIKLLLDCDKLLNDHEIELIANC